MVPVYFFNNVYTRFAAFEATIQQQIKDEETETLLILLLSSIFQ
jgi:hypothetical protein